MDISEADVIDDFLNLQDGKFKVGDFCKFLKAHGVKMSRPQAEDFLQSSEIVFPLVRGEYITRERAFSLRCFTFKPSKEEVEKGHFIIGHRCMPFVNPVTPPDRIIPSYNGVPIKSKPLYFSMNLAMDTFALFGEGYVIPFIFNDRSNEEYTLASLQYSVPSKVRLTAWPLSEISGDKKFEYGDRVICKVVDWSHNLVEMSILKCASEDNVVTEDAFDRENWYSIVENCLLENFDKHGPTQSIEEQLAYLYLENQQRLCVPTSGSIEELLAHTSKIGFESYGVETRIWKKGQCVPYAGKWNMQVSANELMLNEFAIYFTPRIVDAFLEDSLFQHSDDGQEPDFAGLLHSIIPQSMEMTPAEQKELIVNIEKRNEVIKLEYNRFSDFSIADVRRNVLDLFTEVNSLFCAIGFSGLKIEDFPQQELVVLTQLYGHVVRMIEEIENEYLRQKFPKDDISISLMGMEQTFDEIKASLQSALDANRSKGFGLLKQD